MAEEVIVHLEDWQQTTVKALESTGQALQQRLAELQRALEHYAADWGGEGYGFQMRDGELILVKREEPEEEPKE